MLRQRICCLQASIGHNLVTPTRSPYLQKLEADSKDNNYLLITKNDGKETIESEKQVKTEDHLVLLNQLKTDKPLDHIEISEPEWAPSATIFVAPDDHVATERCHLLLTQLSHTSDFIDLKSFERWGSSTDSLTEKILPNGHDWILGWAHKFKLNFND